MPKSIAIIGAGFSGLAAACYLSGYGHEVTVFEKNDLPGGRARQFTTANGYVFDMGPSWYWMPDVFERFFNDQGYQVADVYDLQLLDPAFEIVFPGKQTLAIPENFEKLCNLFESIEKGSAAKLEKFMAGAQYKYETAMNRMVYMPGLSVMEFADLDLLKGALKLEVFSSFSKHVRKYFTNPKLVALMEFPVLFLGAMPQDTPAMYSLMNYAGLQLGTWYPQGGFGKVIDAMVQVAKRNGVQFRMGTPVEQVFIHKSKAKAVIAGGNKINCDAVIATADYHHVESSLLPAEYRNYDDNYWEKKTFAPSCLIYYVGITKKVNLQHHTLFFDEDIAQHANDIYRKPKWPAKPLFYTCCPSRTDKTVAPDGHENLFLLMPLAPGLEDNEALREKYFGIMMKRLEEHAGEPIVPFIDYKQGYCINDFIQDYNSYKGNAYGLANTLSQTALWKPKMKNRKINNLFYAGQLTVPGPGVPPSLISGKIVAEQIQKLFKNYQYEAAV